MTLGLKGLLHSHEACLEFEYRMCVTSRKPGIL